MAADPDFKKHWTLSLQQPHCFKVLITGSETDDAASVLDVVTILEDDSNHSTTPSLHTLEDSSGARQIYFKQCVPLYKAALKGDWKTAKRIIEKDKSILRASITEGRQTVLHVAAGARQVCFVRNLLKLLREDDLILQDINGNTAFCFAVAAGAVRVAKIMIQKNPRLPKIWGGQGMTPLYLAALFGHGHMASYLYPLLIQLVDEGERAGIFFTCINNSLYELALKILLEYPELAEARGTGGNTAFQVLAGDPSAFRLSMWKRFLQTCLRKEFETPGLRVLKLLLGIVSKKLDDGEETVKGILRPSEGEHSEALFIAAKCGNVKFLAELFAYDPKLILEKDERKRNVFHIGTLYHQRIFSLLDRLGVNDKYTILTSVDTEGNTILHLAAKVAEPLKPDDKVKTGIKLKRDLKLSVGPETQRVKRDLKYFKEVEKVVPACCLGMENNERKRPEDVFIEHHGALTEEVPWTTKWLPILFPIVTNILGVLAVAFSIKDSK